ncbi:MAG: hypothetical protein H0X65_14465, partial [Gemmatimonadetes bacterium]|nr:hypothetical protein [Gemmatimonadota bacterium]
MKPQLLSVHGPAIALLLVMLFLPACAEEDAAVRVGPTLTLIAESGSMPPSQTHSLALLDEDHACVLLSYEKQVICGDRSWSDVTVIGKEGLGPGELDSPARVVRGPGHTVGVTDYRTQRFTVFSKDGELLHTVSTPPLFFPLGAFGADTLIGTHIPFTRGDTVGSAPLQWISIPRNEVIRKEKWSHASEASRAVLTGFSAGTG